MKLSLSLLLFCITLVSGSEPVTLVPIEGFINHYIIRTIEANVDACEVLGMSYGPIDNKAPTPDKEGAALWIARITADGKCAVIHRIKHPNPASFTGRKQLDSVVLKLGTNRYMTMFHTGKDELYEFRKITLGGAPGKETKDVIEVAGLPKGYSYGSLGMRSGGLFSVGGKLNIIGMTTNRHDLIVLTGSPKEGFQTLTENKFTSEIRVADVIDDIAFLEVGDQTKIAGGQRRLEALRLRKDAKPEAVCNGSALSPVKIQGGFIVGSNMQPSTQAGEIVLLRLSSQAEWVKTAAIDTTPLALPAGVEVFPGMGKKISVVVLSGRNTAKLFPVTCDEEIAKEAAIQYSMDPRYVVAEAKGILHVGTAATLLANVVDFATEDKKPRWTITLLPK